jgi:hypothetical protein
MQFDLYVGIDYSGAGMPESRLKGLQVYAARRGKAPVKIHPPSPARNWSRREIAHWLAVRMRSSQRLLVGIDHGFSFPESYFRRYRVPDWPAFLEDFCRYWPTDRPRCTVDAVRSGAIWKTLVRPRGERAGGSDEFRLCERWTSSAKSVFQFDMQGSVAKSTHAGIPWLQFLRRELRQRVFFWPFDGWRPPADRSVMVEIYASLFRNRYPRAGRTPDEQDACTVARWLEEAARRKILERYFNPPLTPEERRVAEREGWILGVA